MRKINIIPVIIILTLVLLLDVYVFQGLKRLVLDLSFDVKRILQWSFWLVSLGLITVFLVNFYQSLIKRKISRFFSMVFNTFLTLLVTKLAFALVLFLEDMIRLLAFPFLGEYPGRSFLVSEIAVFVAAIPFFAFLFGVTRGKYHYKVKKVNLYFDDLPEAFSGFTIAQISDIHSGSFDNEKAVQKGIDLIKAQHADLFVFTGDLVNNRSEEIVPYIGMFKSIEAPYGKFSVLGNHDYGDYVAWSNQDEKRGNLAKLRQYHAEMGFRLLLDEYAEIKKQGDRIVVAGVENWGLGFGQRGNLGQALSGVDKHAFKVLLSHDPTHWEAQVKKWPQKIHLTLSGHTHGMQFGIEAFGIKWSPVKYRYPHWAGLKEENGRFLYINRGFGFLGFSGRIGIWPEITLITLKRNT